jgi:hypothetical protein
MAGFGRPPRTIREIKSMHAIDADQQYVLDVSRQSRACRRLSIPETRE